MFITGTTSSNQAHPLTDAFPATQLPVPISSYAAGSSIAVLRHAGKYSDPERWRHRVFDILRRRNAGAGLAKCATGGGIAVDVTGNIYFSGTTNFYNSGSGVYGDSGQSGDFPILNAYQPCLDTPPPTILTNPNPCSSAQLPVPFPTDAFVAKINPAAAAGAQLLFSTYFGGSGTDSGTAIAIDSGAANIYLTGSTNSSDFVIPTGSAPFQLCLDTPVNPTSPPTCTPIASPAPFDAYVARMTNPTQSTTGVPVDVALSYFSYLGGTGSDSGAAIAVLDSSSSTLDDVVITGTTSSTDFPVTTPGAIQSTFGTGATSNAFFAEINTTTTVSQNRVGSFVTYFGGNAVDHGTSIAVDANLNTYFVGDTTSTKGHRRQSPAEHA